MIVKKIKSGHSSKTKARQIADLVDYIRAPHRTHPEEKVAYAGGKNFLGDTHLGQRAEMIALAEESVHSKMPVTHWVFSWQEGENPTHEQVDELVAMFLENMQLSGHQVIYGLHRDTHNYHLHVAVNRMNEITGKVVLPFNGFDIEAAHKAIARIEHRQGWASEKNSMFVVFGDGTVVRRCDATWLKQKDSQKLTQQARDFENVTGAKSALHIAQERSSDIIAQATTWEDLHSRLAEVNLRFEKKGSGAVIIVGDQPVKASSVSRSFSMKNLVKRLGQFEPASTGAQTIAVPSEPVSAVNRRYWKEYQDAMAKAGTVAGMENMAWNAELHRWLCAVKAKHKEQMRRLHSRLAKYGIPVLNNVSRGLRLQQKEEFRLLQGHQSKVRRKRKLTFEQWLRAEGMEEQAECWRHRADIEALTAAMKHPVLSQDTMIEKVQETFSVRVPKQ